MIFVELLFCFSSPMREYIFLKSMPHKRAIMTPSNRIVKVASKSKCAGSLRGRSIRPKTTGCFCSVRLVNFKHEKIKPSLQSLTNYKEKTRPSCHNSRMGLHYSNSHVYCYDYNNETIKVQNKFELYMQGVTHGSRNSRTGTGFCTRL